MSLLSNLITISGIFGKSEELEILPPPPPFPDIEKEHKRIKEAGRVRGLEEKQKEKEFDFKGKKEEQKSKKWERKKVEERKKREEQQLGLEKEELEEEEQFKEIEKLQKPKKSALWGVFGKKKEEIDLGKELEEIEKTAPKPKKEELELEMDFKFPEAEEEITKPEEVIRAEEEIEKAILGMKREPLVKRLFKKRKEEIEEKIETPEVMPRTYDKIDHILLIEEKIHKARLALMDFKFDDAKMAYIEIMRMYSNLEPKQKAKVYRDIKDLYYERKSAERFAK